MLFVTVVYEIVVVCCCSHVVELLLGVKLLWEIGEWREEMDVVDS